jgi:putative ABC transport system permease protein
MFRNYLITSIRNILRHKGYSLINIVGLAVGMAVCILILLWVQYQFNFDRFHENIDDLYWVATWYHLGKDVNGIMGSPPAIGPALKADFPEVIYASRYERFGELLVKRGEKNLREKIRAVDPDFLEMFTFPLIQGNPHTALSEPYSIVISKSKAQKYFGDENPMGQTLIVENKYNFKVTGIMEDTPDNSTIGVNIYVPITFAQVIDGGDYIDTWYNCAFYNFVQLQKGTDYRAFNTKIKGRIKQSFPDSNLESYLVPYSRIHLHGITDQGGLIQAVNMFLIVACLILSIAIINFINLMTARSGRRAQEVGMRKVVGASRLELIKQFFGESIFHAIMAAIFAVVLVEILLPVFRTLMGNAIHFDFFSNPAIPIGILGIAIISGLLAGFYPAILLSSFQPVEVIKRVYGVDTKRSWFRRILVVSQFSVSILLIICTIVIYQQHNHMKNIEVGFDRKNIIYLPMNAQLQSKYESVKARLLQNPNFKFVTKSTHSPSEIYWNGQDWQWEGKDTNFNPLVTYLGVSYDYLGTLGMKLVDGAFFSPEITGNRKDAIIINETFAKYLGPGSAVGKNLIKDKNTCSVVGVVKDFHFTQVYAPVGPLVMCFEPENRPWFLFARIQPNNSGGTLDYIRSVWKDFDPDFPAEIHFLEDDFKNFYSGEKTTGDLLGYFAAVAIIISCMGLFGLACFMAERRTKEIGIRKVLGATVSGLVQLLSKEFVILVVVSNLIATPIAYLLMRSWLQHYVYRINIGISVFVLVAILSMLIAIITVSFQAIRTALANPVNSLRYE